MDEFNNNPFNEEKSGGNSANQYGQQGMQGQQEQQPQQYQQPQNYDPYNQQPVQGQQQYNLPPQNGQNSQNSQNPYGAQGGYNYNQQDIPQGGYVPPQGYTANQGYGYGTPYQPQQSTGMAVASLVLGIISICSGLFMFAFPFLFLMPIIGIILGIVFKCKKLPVGKGLSTAGIVTSVIGLILPILFIVLILMNMSGLLHYIKTVSPDQYEQLYEMYGDQFPQWFEGAVSFLIK